ncbi:hypothetical protein EYF80_036247 [Liparis tanakae]|uniref:Uncharacterized protein n=1 Tax=Liparis tanakae TaxID=230148 RepID=A0A4Z2GJ75_9TELE|nr:hypothetical protein EYF80_036247 [Liparis tanakae]
MNQSAGAAQHSRRYSSEEDKVRAAPPPPPAPPAPPAPPPCMHPSPRSPAADPLSWFTGQRESRAAVTDFSALEVTHTHMPITHHRKQRKRSSIGRQWPVKQCAAKGTPPSS